MGLAVIQWYWITGALKVREKQFETAVGEALSRVSKRIDQDDQTRRMLGEFDLRSNPDKVIAALADSMLFSEPDTVRTEYYYDEGLTESGVADHYDDPIQGGGSRRISVFSAKGPNYSRSGRVELKTTVGPEGVRIIRKVYQLDSLFQSLVRSGLTNPPLDERIDESRLRRLLDEEFAGLGKGVDYRFGIFDRGLPTGIGDSTVGATEEVRSIKLFQSDVRPGNIELRVFAEDSAGILDFKGLWGLVALGLIFTAGVAFLFAYTLREALDQKKLSEMKTDFINNMTHEFKTPIATINLALDACDSPGVWADPQRIQRYTNIIRQENQRMNRQVEDVLRLSMLDRRQLHLDFAPVHLHTLLKEIVGRFELKLEEAKAALVWDLKAESDLIEADVSQMGTVLQNLIDNALKYANGPLMLTLRTWNETDRVCLAVGDNGQGMDHQVMSHLFDRFYRGQSGNIHTVKGHGLGLSFVKEMIHLHSGTVSVISALGQGSTFTLQLPLHHAERNRDR